MFEIIFSFAAGLMLPVLMFTVARLFEKCPPSGVGSIGYNTSFSQTNEDTWNEGNRILAMVWKKLGIISFAVSVPCLALFAFIFTGEAVLIAMAGLTTAQCIAMLASIVFIERELRKIFTPEGERRNNADISRQ